MRRERVDDLGDGRTIKTVRDTNFGWACTIDPPTAGPLVVFEDPVLEVPRAIRCTTLRWEINYGTHYGARGVQVEGWVSSSRTGRPQVTADGEPVRKVMHLRRVLDVR